MVSAALSAVGYAGFGLLARFYALGIQKRPLMDKPAGHIAFMGAFGLIGYWFHGIKQKQEQLLEQKTKQLAERRTGSSE
ncbi:hypothetical protein MCUN1_000508 [Malassezia cuniculi]|uniref:Uncharacterized protein n=1 Tax=Malassezia cuniculi TaxID=948313 RepID=A0AAF0ERC3_9BASI|nr:hypothetical protein MCUN1_000508 [Malassezia cuniculi]